MIIAREFAKNDEQQVINFIDEIREYDGNFEGIDNFGRAKDFDEFLQTLEKNKHQELIKPSYSPQTTFGVFDNERLIGAFNLRHELKGNLINHGGNIGYLVRPSQRQKGYGTMILECALKKAKEISLGKVLISCRKENIVSSKVIEKNGGVYENDYYDEQNDITYKRYWINLKKMKNWINVCEYNKKTEESMEWLFKILDEEKIPYKQEIKENWFGHRMPTYQENIVVYVSKEYKEKVESYLKEYNNPNNIAYEDVEELRGVSDDEDEELKDIKKGKMAKKMFAWIPIGMVLIVIVCAIISSVIY